MSDTKTKILAAVAADLRGSGYPSATAETILAGGILSAFTRDTVLKYGRAHIANDEVQYAVASIIADIDKATGAEV